MTNLSDHSLSVTRRISAKPERVFAAWTNSRELRAWFHPGPDFETLEASCDPRMGGSYRILMRNRETGEEHLCVGEYREVSPATRLQFTWSWERGGSPGTGDTLVTVDLKPVGEGTELTVTHVNFSAAEAAEDHEQGWGRVLASLEGHVSA